MKKYLYHYFISYPEEEYRKAIEIADSLIKRNKDVWIARRKLFCGDNIPIKIAEGLALSKRLIVLVSRAGAGSEWMEMELASFLHQDPSGRRRSIIPILLDETPCPESISNRLYLEAASGIDADLIDEILKA